MGLGRLSGEYFSSPIYREGLRWLARHPRLKNMSVGELRGQRAVHLLGHMFELSSVRVAEDVRLLKILPAERRRIRDRSSGEADS